MKLVAKEANKLNLDILCLTETKKKGCENGTVLNYVHLWSGVPKEERARVRVSVLIKKTNFVHKGQTSNKRDILYHEHERIWKNMQCHNNLFTHRHHSQ